MQIHRFGMVCGFAALFSFSAFAQAPAPAAPQGASADDPIRTLVSRLELDKYKATVKGLTQFGDRRQGTKRNRDAVDWIEAQLRSYGCSDVSRIKYTYTTPQRGTGRGGAGRGGGRGAGR